MSKRSSGIANLGKSHSKKTKKRLAIKKEMLAFKALKPAAKRKLLAAP